MGKGTGTGQGEPDFQYEQMRKEGYELLYSFQGVASKNIAEKILLERKIPCRIVENPLVVPLIGERNYFTFYVKDAFLEEARKLLKDV